MDRQEIITVQDGDYSALDLYLDRIGSRKVLLVAGGSIRFQAINEYFLTLRSRRGIEVVRFGDFEPNPLYESVVRGVQVLHRSGCDTIIAVGGGSAMDVAKCIKLYSNMDPNINYLQQDIVANDIPFIAVPTTAGTGSEATRFAVIYYDGVKQSVNHISGIPCAVVMDGSVLSSLPVYHKKCAMLDALCHAIESCWSVNSTDESKSYSLEAIRLIVDRMDAYLAGDSSTHMDMLRAANLAGKAINLAQTTAGHAMCYKITSLCHTAHGHSVLLCNRVLFPWLIQNTDRCIDPRGEAYLIGTLEEIAGAMGFDTAAEAAASLETLRQRLELPVPSVTAGELDILCAGVNPIRLKNFPAALDEGTIRSLYGKILNT